jgi:hypothetical protein
MASALGAGISAIGSIWGASEAADAAEEAAQAQVQAAQIASDTQKDFFGQAKNALTPYMNLGNQAAGTLGAKLDSLTAPIAVPTMTQADLEATPGYAFTLGQGLKATQNSAAARGLGVSGAALKGAATYATGLSDSTYNTRFGQAQTQWQDNVANQQNAYNKLIGVTGIGGDAAGALAGRAIQTGQGIAQTQVGSGNAQAAGINGAGQATAAGIMGATGAFNNALQQYTSGNGLYGGGNKAGLLDYGGIGSALSGGF